MRGLAALWVVIGHAMILSGWSLPILGKPAFAVDLFILISGFLMCFHYRERKAAEPWTAPATWTRFWIRRFFRIAPLYYAALAAALLAGPALGPWRQAISTLVPASATAPERYTDQSLANIAAHASFVFGLLPDYGFRTALPDWSIGLEMQYYLAFPFLMLAIARAGAAMACVGLAAACITAGLLFKGSLTEFTEPSLLILKLPIFLAGMLIADALDRPGRVVARATLGAILLATLPIGAFDGLAATLIRAAIAGGFALLIHQRSLAERFRWLGRADALLGGRLGHFLGEMSYGVYLIHLLVLIPILGLLSARYGQDLSSLGRFAIAAPVTIAMTYLIAAAMHAAIEMPGIAIGRRIIGSSRHDPDATADEMVNTDSSKRNLSH